MIALWCIERVADFLKAFAANKHLLETGPHTTDQDQGKKDWQEKFGQ